MILTLRIGRLFSSSKGKVKSEIQYESNTIVDPYFYEQTDLVSRLQNWFSNRGTLTDMERSFRDFSKSKVNSRFLQIYNNLRSAIEHERFDIM